MIVVIAARLPHDGATTTPMRGATVSIQSHVTGNLAADPVLRTHEGRSVADMRVASTLRVPDGQGGFKDGSTTFLDVVAWGALAENAARSFHKGDAVIASGRLDMRSFTPTRGEHAGQEQLRPELTADVIGASVQFATVVITRVRPGATVTDQEGSASAG
jgi:single-strand DNA-binding protein